MKNNSRLLLKTLLILTAILSIGWTKRLRIIVFVMLVIIWLPTFGEAKVPLSTPEENTCIEKIDLIFHDYISFGESVDSEHNKKTVADCLKHLENSELTSQNLRSLIELWLYYDPTDFPTRDLVFDLFKTRKSESIKAINNRIKEKQSWENKQTAPFSDLIHLLEKLEKE